MKATNESEASKRIYIDLNYSNTAYAQDHLNAWVAVLSHKNASSFARKPSSTSSKQSDSSRNNYMQHTLSSKSKVRPA